MRNAALSWETMMIAGGVRPFTCSGTRQVLRAGGARLAGVRLRIDLAYDGGGFHGWARQDGLRTVQGELEAALATVLRLPAVAVTCAGRTDTGVHARGQVAHTDVDEPAYDGEQLRRRLDGMLPDDILVRR